MRRVPSNFISQIVKNWMQVLIVALRPKHGLGAPRLHTSLCSSVFLGVQFLLGSLIAGRDFRWQRKKTLDWCSSNTRLVGFALCHFRTCGYGWGCIHIRCSLLYKLTFEFDGRTHILPIPNHDRIKNCFSWKGRERNAVQSHTFIWKYQLDFQSINGNMLFRADNFTFEFNKYNYRSKFKPTDMVKRVRDMSSLYQRKGS